ncbi:acyltransferase family protein [Nocardioides sp. YIM 152315]|uniref:acyltransferase family protein n=1 Tax=Nocardioides sp. YIM 152315 TaxID=3031760 RepID=UPI0023DAA7A1|nr:acyltransferase family protein [Nocardioides sp. YIM 152315]MDF1606063.1 acyltransferase family protein [Nocardioides sp. YIM 152315]
MWEYRPQLDGLRFVAVMLVLAFHAGMASVSGGFIGVDLFFVLSGFLVTNVILSEVDRRGSFSLGSFYGRRVRRLLPAAVLAITVTCVLAVLVTPEASRISMVSDARSALLYYSNWQFIADANDYFGDGVSTSPFLHYWSLSIEEQYYIVYPLVVFLVLTKARQSERRLGVLLAALAAVSVGLQVFHAASDVNFAYYATQTRIYQPLVGCVLAIVLRELGRRGMVESRGVGAVAGTLGVIGVVVLASGWVDVSESVRGLWCAVAAVAAVGGVCLAPLTSVSRMLSWSVPRYLGQISYGTYLWHWPVILVTAQLFDVRPLVLALMATAIATGLAALSFQVFETPIRRSRSLARTPWPVVVSGLAASVLVAAVVVPVVLESERQPVVAASGPGASAPIDVPDRAKGTGDVAAALAELDEPVPKDVDFEELAHDEGEIGPQCSDGTPASCVVVDDNDGPLVVLIGDSHAAMLATALHRLAEEKGFRLSTNILNNCPWQDGIGVTRVGQARQDECSQMRSRFYDEILPEMDADVVVTVGKARSDGHWARDTAADDAAEHPDESFDQMLLRKSQESVEKIRDTGARVLLMHSVFGTGGYDVGGPDPLDCLSVAKQQADCAVVPPTARPSIDSFYDFFTTTMPDVHSAEIRDAYCPGRVLCAPIVDGEVTWHDADHLSKGLVMSIRGQIWAQMKDSGAFDGLELDSRE